MGACGSICFQGEVTRKGKEYIQIIQSCQQQQHQHNPKTLRNISNAQQITALQRLWDFAEDKYNDIPLLHPQLQLLPTLHNLLEEIETQRLKAEFYVIGGGGGGGVEVVAEEVKELQRKTIGILWYLSRTPFGAISIMNQAISIPLHSSTSPFFSSALTTTKQEITLLTTLFKIVKEPIYLHQDYRRNILKIFNNLSKVRELHPLILKKNHYHHPLNDNNGYNYNEYRIDKSKDHLHHYEWFEFWQQEMQITPFAFYKSIANFVWYCQDEKYIYDVFGYSFPHFILQQFLNFGTNPKKWNDRFGEIPHWCLNFLVGLSTFTIGANFIRQQQPLPTYFLKILKHRYCIEQIKIAILLSNVYQEDENNHSMYPRSQVAVHGRTVTTISNSELIGEALLTILQHTIHPIFDSWVTIQNYNFGIITLRQVLIALKHFVLTETNQKFIFQSNNLSHLLTSLYTIMKDFLAAKPEYSWAHNSTRYVGGGVEDTESIQFVLELLLLVSFRYDYEHDLKSNFTIKIGNIQSIVRSVLRQKGYVTLESSELAMVYLSRFPAK